MPNFVVTIIFQDVAWSVKLGAVSNVNNHLLKLVKEGRVDRVGFDSYRLAASQKAVEDRK